MPFCKPILHSLGRFSLFLSLSKELVDTADLKTYQKSGNDYYSMAYYFELKSSFEGLPCFDFESQEKVESFRSYFELY